MTSRFIGLGLAVALILEMSTAACRDRTTGADTEPVQAAPPIIRVTPDQADQLAALVAEAPALSTILLEDGLYQSDLESESQRRLIFRRPGVTLKSASGRAEAVVIDGQYRTGELLFVLAANVVVADLTLTRSIDHLIHVSTPGAEAVTGVQLRNLRLIDGGEQFVKINAGGQGGFVDDGLVEDCFFQLTEEGRPHIERQPGGCYTGGIDAHAARGWIVRGNHFRDIYCAGEGLAEHAVHFWRSSRDTQVENNHIINCARGIGFGLDDTQEARVYADDPYPGIRPIAHFDGLIRNNVIFAAIPWYDTGIELHYARGAQVYHNTVVSTTAASGFFSSIDYRFPPTQVRIYNNLTRRITRRAEGEADLQANLQDTPLSYFANAEEGDFHLVASANRAIDQGLVVAGAGLDLDGTPHDRGSGPDLGADER
ncbi:MAG: hypothetical protein GKR89_29535 [Candidatus Latescibacteria bacterium]|nr:hypothetical protein [Candidatus Latescibacterota bacterium]